ncbi:hypothetical protein BC629DRAFT_1567090 [Irpex lacteus]|nr:hypothetical protein BC629DRAFT_1567090 [Irpex lacteus]
MLHFCRIFPAIKTWQIRSEMTFHTIHRRTLICTVPDVEALRITLSYFSTSTYRFFSFNSTRYTGSYSSVIRSLHSLLIHRLIVYSCQDDFIHVAQDVLGHLERRRTTRTEESDGPVPFRHLITFGVYQLSKKAELVATSGSLCNLQAYGILLPLVAMASEGGKML